MTEEIYRKITKSPLNFKTDQKITHKDRER